MSEAVTSDDFLACNSIVDLGKQVCHLLKSQEKCTKLYHKI
ncbi:MAG: hypothetical protein JWQ34_2460 [Mucilaginibacter sp.]|nr:hypothetical protein [Mucilaginibacter sp.]